MSLVKRQNQYLGNYIYIYIFFFNFLKFYFIFKLYIIALVLWRIHFDNWAIIFNKIKNKMVHF